MIDSEVDVPKTPFVDPSPPQLVTITADEQDQLEREREVLTSRTGEDGSVVVQLGTVPYSHRGIIQVTDDPSDEGGRWRRFYPPVYSPGICG